MITLHSPRIGFFLAFFSAARASARFRNTPWLRDARAGAIRDAMKVLIGAASLRDEAPPPGWQ
jgi:hypothetical protein